MHTHASTLAEMPEARASYLPLKCCFHSTMNTGQPEADASGTGTIPRNGVAVNLTLALTPAFTLASTSTSTSAEIETETETEAETETETEI